MPVLKVSNLLGGINYAVNPIYIDDTQLTDAKNVVSINRSPLYADTSLSSIAKVGLNGRGTLRQLNASNAGNKINVQKAVEYSVLDQSASVAGRQWEVVMLGTAVRVGAIRDQGTTPIQAPVKIYFDVAAPTFTPSEWVIGAISEHLIISAYTASAAVGEHYIWNGSFETQGNVNIVAGATAVTGSGTNFLGVAAVKAFEISAQPKPYDKIKVGKKQYTFRATTEATFLDDEIKIGGTDATATVGIASTAAHIRSKVNSDIAATLCSAAAVTAAESSRVTFTAVTPGIDFQLIETTGSVILTSTATQNVESVGSNSFINFGGETTGGVDNTGWYKITGVTTDTDLTIDPSHVGALTGATYSATLFQKYDPLNLDWRITAIGQHKGRALLGTLDSTGMSYLFMGKVGAPKTIESTGVFKIGDAGEKISMILDVGDYSLLIKEHSAWAFYLNSVTPSLSALYQLDRWKGVMNDRAAVETPFGIVVLTPRDGFYLHTTDTFLPIIPSLEAKFRSPDDNMKRAALTYSNDRLYIALPSFEGVSTVLFSYDLRRNVLERDDYPALTGLATDRQMHLLPGAKTFNRNLKLAYGTTAIQEGFYFNAPTSIAAQLLETSVPCEFSTRKFPIGVSSVDGLLRYFILEFSTKDLNPITVTPYFDGASSPDLIFTPTVPGFNRKFWDMMSHNYRGKYMQLKFAFTQNITNNNVPTQFYRLFALYDIDSRFTK